MPPRRWLLGATTLLLALTVSLAVVPADAVVPTRTGAAPTSPVSADLTAKQGGTKKADPRLTRGLFVDPFMKAANAGAAFARIGSQAQPLWITDYYSTPGSARQAVRSYVTRATKAGKTPLLTVYNIPDRDCGMYSSQDDQITDDYYRSWVTQVAAGLKGSKPIVILEPDAIPFIGNPACTGRGDRLGLIRYATQALTKAGAWVYLDAGHSGWQTPAHMAPLLKQAGAKTARGIATNVANTRATIDEHTYAKAVVAQLKQRKVGDVHYVVDTSRNGAGRNGPENGDVCNAPAARIGSNPRLQFKGSYDGNLWIKLPGESDGDGGDCNGGPASGEFFPDGACRLLGRSFYDTITLTCS